MADVSLQELTEIIQKSGLPMIDELKWKESPTFYQEQFQPYIQSKYAGQLGKIDEDKKAKVEALANVDSQMNKIFGKGGKYELINPMGKEQLATGMHNLRLGDFNRTAQEQANLLGQIDTETGQYATLYNSLLPNKGTGYGEELSILASIFGIDLNNLGDVNDIFNKDGRPDISTFDDDRPDLNLFDLDEGNTGGSGRMAKRLRGVDIIEGEVG